MDHPAIFLTLVNLSGGMMGYQRKGSLISLLGGTTLSATFARAAYLIRYKIDVAQGISIALYSSLVLFMVGMIRGVSSNFEKQVPIILICFGLLSSLYYFYKSTIY
ncbi:Tmh11p NDAI_0E04690 [Naumovozyma dairenensis CBS 421]|uniref:Uncharacterized protein n=1 Tax=Naumovozyma dairenensis (strain ATCC 10597 / BCRC 20456 / CBS 421 / NBRC 0211 / NRRL Y-12639) TaxID=1071378 RepID=G0WC16_NAUDC|nr:hypothetical protein NDAI_0E04690 [Naumovozyma dairenensis CBS 421]CCD25286.1 hypothetical protein NDAI_0E04690 [Naumovozyma dairenensis CBS 421]